MTLPPTVQVVDVVFDGGVVVTDVVVVEDAPSLHAAKPNDSANSALVAQTRKSWIMVHPCVINKMSAL